jgi:hypothetical protein
MAPVLTVTFLVGLIFGQRLRAIVLIPATAMAVFFAITIGLLRGNAAHYVAAHAALAAVALQIGYLLGSTYRT